MNLLDETNGRYHRQELITWWDQSRLLSAKVLVVGAGALGNEVVKNLALVGVGLVDIVDMDIVEHSNLARCVFFRTEDEGSFKATALARAAAEINPDVQMRGFPVPVQRLGLAELSKYDLIIGALDNREARAWVNQAARKLGVYWIDGAIEGLRGLARMFGPDGPCYACTLTEADWIQMSHRKSCALIAPEEILTGKTPTNATTAAVIAGVQVQEAIKLLVGQTEMLSLVGRCWTFTGDSMDSYIVNYREDEFCMAHDRYEELLEIEAKTPAQLLNLAGESINAVDFEEDLITLHSCSNCGGAEITRARSALSEGDGRCENCGETRIGALLTSLEPGDERLNSSFVELGLGHRDVVTLRSGDVRRHFVVEGVRVGQS